MTDDTLLSRRMDSDDKSLEVAFKAHTEMHAAETRAMNLAYDSHRDLHDAAKEALDKASMNMDAKIAEMNNFRRQLEQERAEYPTRTELGLQLKAIFERMDRREQEVDARMEKMTEDTSIRLNLIASEYNRRVSAMELSINSVQPVALSVAENSRRLNVLENTLSNLQGRLVVIGGVLSLIPIIISIALHFIK